MKTALKISAFLMVFLAFAACKNKAKGTAAKTEAAKEAPKTTITEFTTYPVNSGTLNWIGSKAIGDSHQGTIQISDGKLGVGADGQIKAGSFTIDMASITNTDLEAGKGKEKLEGHLKNADFFDVGQFPTGTFNIIKVEPVSGVTDVTHNITGNLTLKGVKKSITIPANIAIANGKISAVTPSFTINRTDWGIKYGSSGSFADLAKDRIINDDIALVLQVEATAPAN